MDVYTTEIYQPRGLAYTCAGKRSVLRNPYQMRVMGQRESGGC